MKTASTIGLVTTFALGTMLAAGCSSKPRSSGTSPNPVTNATGTASAKPPPPAPPPPRPPPALDSGVKPQNLSPAGGTCKTVADCQAGLDICNEDPGGQCTKECKVDSDCAAHAGAICEVGGGHCYHQCTTHADCTRQGYACVGGETGHKFCDPKHEAGDSCDNVGDCADGLDICNEDPGGQCTKDCKTQVDCPSGSVCENPGHCYHECTTKADCPRDGYDCLGGPNSDGKKWCDIVPAADAGTD